MSLSPRSPACGLLALLLALFGAPAPGLAQIVTDQGQFGLWTLQCAEEAPEARNCWLFQRLVNQADRTQLADIRLGLAESGDVTRRVLFMHAPTGILLTARAAYRVDNDAVDIPLNWLNCTERRCTAVRPLEADEFDRLQRGGRMVIGYQPLQAPQPTVFEVSLIGVTAGFKALEARLGAN